MVKDIFLHFLNRLLNPIVKLDTQDEVMEFFDSADKGLWKGDYETAFFKKSKDTNIPNLDEPVSKLDLRTRVVVFIFEKDEYREEIK